MPRVECPKCTEWVDVSAQDFGRMMNCGSCGAAFPAIETPETDDKYERRTEDDEAKRLLQGPSRALVILSIISLIASCILGAAYFILGMSKFRFMRGNNSNADFMMLLGILTAVLGSVYCLLILIGASRMHDPRQRNWPLVSAILATAAILICWPIPLLNVVLGIFGILALRRHFHPAVKAAARPEWDRAISEASSDPREFDADEETRRFSAYFSEDYEPADSGERAAVIAEAQRRARVPALGLMVTGIVGIAAAVLMGLGIVISLITDFPRDASRVLTTMGSFVAIAFYNSLIVMGGRSLGRLQNRTMSYIAATLALISVGFCGVWIVISIPGVIFSTWAYIALGTREVRLAMRWKRIERDEQRRGNF